MYKIYGLIMISMFYLMTGLVYREGGFDGAFVIKPYPILGVTFGGGEEGTWARQHPMQDTPWFMRTDLIVISHFDWESGSPFGTTAYIIGYLLVLLSWLSVLIIVAIKKAKIFLNREKYKT